MGQWIERNGIVVDEEGKYVFTMPKPDTLEASGDVNEKLVKEIRDGKNISGM